MSKTNPPFRAGHVGSLLHTSAIHPEGCLPKVCVPSPTMAQMIKRFTLLRTGPPGAGPLAVPA